MPEYSDRSFHRFSPTTSMRWSSHCVSFDIVFSLLAQSLLADQHSHAEGDPFDFASMNRPVGKPFPIRIDLLQPQHVAVVVPFDDPTEIALAVAKPDDVILPKGELLSRHAFKQRDGIVRIFRFHRLAIDAHGELTKVLWNLDGSLFQGQSFQARPGADSVKSCDFSEWMRGARHSRHTGTDARKQIGRAQF